jgi:hypothetical protein
MTSQASRVEEREMSNRGEAGPITPERERARGQSVRFTAPDSVAAAGVAASLAHTVKSVAKRVKPRRASSGTLSQSEAAIEAAPRRW